MFCEKMGLFQEFLPMPDKTAISRLFEWRLIEVAHRIAM
jgi:hypothetical protein